MVLIVEKIFIVTIIEIILTRTILIVVIITIIIVINNNDNSYISQRSSGLSSASLYKAWRDVSSVTSAARKLAIRN